MSICPKGKTSRARRDKRRAQTWKIAMPSLATCSKCGALMRAHRACMACGNYDRKQILKVD